ncbi:MAG: hypothetical protein HYX92_12430 [Chloroflexi bacterium]|nr:hypothetical protein [Chloroflexota bacterium]
MKGPTYKVVWPLGRRHSDKTALSSPLDDLSGKTVCEIWDRQFRGDEVFPVIRQRLQQLYPDLRFVGHEEFGNIHGPDERQTLELLPGLLRKHGCDLAITGVGA